MSGLVFRGGTPTPPATSSTSHGKAKAPRVMAESSSAADAADNHHHHLYDDDDDGGVTSTTSSSSGASSLWRRLTALLTCHWARLERLAGGPKRLRVFAVVFSVLKFLAGTACLLLARRHYGFGGGGGLNHHQDQQQSNIDDDIQVPLPYALAATGARATGLAIGVVSGSGAAQRRRVRLLQETWATSLDPARDGLLVFSDATDAAVPAVGIAQTGSTWAGAQDRFLPALAFLRRAFPAAAWYLLVDDDTFLVPSNLRSMLATRDATSSWYVGRAMFVDPSGGRRRAQDGEEGDGEGKGKGKGKGKGSSPALLPFAHGGSGICLSRGLMEAFTPHLERVVGAGKALAENEALLRGCSGTGYGDGDLALCLKTALGVEVTHEACLHSAGPAAYAHMADGGFLLSNLERPCSFHHTFSREGKGEGRREDDAEDGQIRRWHRRYNLGETKAETEAEIEGAA